jgi:hypothetical protein
MPKKQKIDKLAIQKQNGGELINENTGVYHWRGFGGDSNAVLISEDQIYFGTLSARVKLSHVDGSNAGRLVIGYNGSKEDYYIIGVVGYNAAYAFIAWKDTNNRCDKHDDDVNAIKDKNILFQDKWYEIKIEICYSKVLVYIDGIEQFVKKSVKLFGGHIGIFAWGKEDFWFKDICIETNALERLLNSCIINCHKVIGGSIILGIVSFLVKMYLKFHK